jgi:hypothetical protein
VWQGRVGDHSPYADWEEKCGEMGGAGNRKGCDIGYALAAGSCEGVSRVEHAPSQPLMRPLLSQFQTPTASREGCRFFRVWLPVWLPVGLITQLTLDWPLIRKPTLSAIDGR